MVRLMIFLVEGVLDKGWYMDHYSFEVPEIVIRKPLWYWKVDVISNKPIGWFLLLPRYFTV